jgi:hypothetical protein
MNDSDILDELEKWVNNRWEPDGDTTDDWYSHGWEDCREHIIRYIEELRQRVSSDDSKST